jgi:hypothetical protein
LDHAIEQLARLADEGKTLRVFVGSGPFPDEAETRLAGTAGEDGLGAAGVERAARAGADGFGE